MVYYKEITAFKLFFLFSLFHICLFSQVDNWVLLDQNNSEIPDNSINSLSINESGVILIGTNNGLVKYNASNWTLFNSDNSGIPYNRILKVMVDDNNNYWLNSDGGLWGNAGLTTFNGLEWSTYNTTNSQIPFDGFNSIDIDNVGKIWIGSVLWGIASFHNDEWSHFTTSNSSLIDNHTSAIDVDSENNIWVGTNYSGLVKFSTTGDWINFNKSNSELPDNYIADIFITSNNEVWIASSNHITKLSGDVWSVYYLSDAGVSKFHTVACQLDLNDNLWIISNGDGILKFDGNNWEKFDKLNSPLPTNQFTDLIIDGNNNKWFGTVGSGIILYNENGVLLDSISTWNFSVKVGVSKPTADYYGENNITSLITEQFKTINDRYNSFFESKIVFSVDSIYIFNSNPTEEIFKSHPQYDYAVIYDGYPIQGGGWYGQPYNTIHHSWSVDDFDGPFGDFANDGLTHEFGHSRGAIDLYAIEVPADSNNINNQDYQAPESIMNVPYGKAIWDEHSINLINMNENSIINSQDYVTESFPSKIEILVTDNSGNPMPDVNVLFFPIEWYSKKVNENIYNTYVTNSDGIIEFTDNPFKPKTSGYPWDIRYPNFLVTAEYLDASIFTWLPITEVQNHYFGDSSGIYRDTLKLPIVNSVTEKDILPIEFSLKQNYPNPFNPSTLITYTIPYSQLVNLQVYDILGNEIVTLVDEFQAAGKYEVKFKASEFSSGVYFYRIICDKYSATKKMLQLR